MLYFILATPPALFGQADSEQKTASGYAQMRAQAMGRLGIAWASVQRMMARMYYQAALCASRNPDHSEEIVVPGNGGQNVTLRLERLRKGKFGCYPDEDSSFPESTAAKRQTLTGIVTMAAQSPVGMQIFESPDNWELFKQLMGFPELTLVEAEARNKQVRELELLLQQSPIPPDPQEIASFQAQHAAQTIIAQQSGAKAPDYDTAQWTDEDGNYVVYPMVLLKPSVPVNDYDFHAYEAKKCQEWLSSEACWRERAEGNMAGITNVVLHWKAHVKAAAAQVPPPPMTMPQAKLPAPQGELGAPNAISAPPGAPGAQTM